jgi:ubiquinone/menaquinone biosynthesis C-methylase UbiE
MIHCLGGRVLKPEILDTLPPDEARASLADLVRINRYWGGHSTARKLIESVTAPGETFSLLDVGAASGDMGRVILQVRPGARVTSLDYIASHLEKAEPPRVAADAFALPFRDNSFDYVFNSLFLHHFDDHGAVQLLREFGRVARKRVLAIDLWRHPAPYYFIAHSRWLFHWHPVSVYDGAISVEAAFKKRELERLARRAGLTSPETRAYMPAFRLTLSAEAL